MEYKDYYKILGVDKNATEDEIKRVYRKLARKYHPDLNKDEGAEAKFKEIGEANDVLSDPEKRAAYDQIGQGYQAGQDFNPPPGWDQGFEFTGRPSGGQAGPEDFSDFFEDLFGRAQRQQQGPHGQARSQAGFNAKGQDHHARISIDLDDTFKGAKRQITLKMPELSPDGHVVLKQHKLDVSIPKGVREGQSIRLKKQGAPGIGKGEPGDLYLEINFRPHKLYHPEGTDLYLDLPVAPWEAALGAKISVPTPGGTVGLNIPANSKQGQKLRLKGRGIPAKPPGDLYVVLQIALPPANTDKAKEVYKNMAKEFDFNPRAHLAAAL
ncbi:MAG TPA: J domain-containing protein [Rhizobiales bacterium]|nr:J domain-containing protein [Hyphomicrobiales bacterium]